jgi:hypothetical protein
MKWWTKYGKKFAEFYIANFMPHDCFYGNSFPDSTYLSFESLSERIEKMEKSPRLVDRMRDEAMMTYICGFRTNSKKHKLLDNFRHRCTTRWTDANSITKTVNQFPNQSLPLLLQHYQIQRNIST